MIEQGKAMLLLIAKFPFRIGWFSNDSSARLSSAFQSLELDIGAGKYLSGSLALSFFISCCSVFFLSLAIESPPLELLGAFLLIFGLSFALLLSFPRALDSKMQEQMEFELPFLLREFSIYLEIGLPFEKCMRKIASRDYLLSRIFARAHRELSLGATVQSALASLSSGKKSMALKRSSLLLSSIYETGASPEPLTRLADELSAAQLASMRTQSSRLQLIAILFVALSALVPSFFSVLAAVSPLVSDGQMPEIRIWLSFLLLFPLSNAFCLAAMAYLLPSVSSPSLPQAQLFNECLANLGFKWGRKSLLFLFVSLSALFFLLFFLAGLFPLSLLSLCIAPSAYLALSYLSNGCIRASEGYLPDALYSASSLHRLVSPEKMLGILARGGYGRLSEAFGIALGRLKAGEGFSSAMAAAFRHCPSPLTKRAFDLLTVAYESGANMHTALRQTAQDTVSFFALVRERAAQLSMQRYTILAACAFLVPFILGTVVSIVPSLAISSSLSSGTHSFPPPIIALAMACQAYLLITSFLSSLLLAYLETDPKKAALYFPLIASLSLAAFSFASQGGLSILSA